MNKRIPRVPEVSETPRSIAFRPTCDPEERAYAHRVLSMRGLANAVLFRFHEGLRTPMQRYTAGRTALSSAPAFDECTLPLSPSPRPLHVHSPPARVLPSCLRRIATLGRTPRGLRNACLAFGRPSPHKSALSRIATPSPRLRLIAR